MPSSPFAITRKGMFRELRLTEEIISLYENEPDLLRLPAILFETVSRLIDADVVSYTEFHHPSGEFRSLLSFEDEPQKRARSIAAYARHMHSHPFWQRDPAFFGERALRESDFFTEEEFFALPIVKESFLPSDAHHIMAIVMQHDGYVVTVSGHRVANRPPFSDRERDLLEAYRPYVLHNYRQAQERTVAKLTPADRLRFAFPELTPRQLEVASWIARGKSNEDIAEILDVGIDAIKAHVKAIHEKIGADGRLATAVIAHTVPPFARLPPLWKLDICTWKGKGISSGRR
jgi:DNA-binding CsgD family transcriptional regulator